MPLTAAFSYEMNFCLDCQACETACPAGVKYGSMVEAARVEVDNSKYGRSFKMKLKKFVLNKIFTSKKKLKIISKLLYYYQITGIQKLLHSSGILKLISSDFLKLVLLANIIAWPAAYWAATKYLEEYAYRISLTPTIFILAGLMALVISFTTIAAQIIKVSRSNPVDALRYE